jgi:hypothetical protein
LRRHIRVLITTVFAFSLLLCVSFISHAAQTRFWLATHYDWASNQGFFLDIENDTKNDDDVAPLKSAAIIFSVANGKGWRYVNTTAKWELNKEYTVKAVIKPDTAELYLADKLKGRAKGVFQASSASCQVNGTPDWAAGIPGYKVFVKSIKMSTSGGDSWEATYDEGDFDASLKPSVVEGWETPEDETTTVEVVFKFLPLD